MTTVDPVEQSYMRKVTLRLAPLLFIAVALGFLNRSNIAYAALSLKADIGLDPVAYGWAVSLFFAGYFCFEAPGTIALRRLGARVWLPFLTAVWGLLMIATAFVRDVTVLQLLRFLMGAAEAGFFPGSVLLMQYWVPRAHRSKFGGRYMVAMPIAMTLGGPLSGLLLGLDGKAGLHGWQWLFLMEGLPCLALAVLLAVCLVSLPDQAAWLTTEEKRFLADARRAEEDENRGASHAGARSLLADGRYLLLCTSFGIGAAISTGVTFWLPQAIAGFGRDAGQIGLLSAAFFLVASVSMWFWSRLDLPEGAHLAMPFVVAALGLAASLVLPTPALKFAALLVSGAGMFSYLPVAWAASHQLFRGPVAAIGYAVLNMCGAAGGITVPYVLGALNQHFGNQRAGAAFLVVLAAIAAVAAFRFGALRQRLPAPEYPLEPAMPEVTP